MLLFLTLIFHLFGRLTSDPDNPVMMKFLSLLEVLQTLRPLSVKKPFTTNIIIPFLMLVGMRMLGDAVYAIPEAALSVQFLSSPRLITNRAAPTSTLQNGSSILTALSISAKTASCDPTTAKA